MHSKTFELTEKHDKARFTTYRKLINFTNH